MPANIPPFSVLGVDHSFLVEDTLFMNSTSDERWETLYLYFMETRSPAFKANNVY